MLRVSNLIKRYGQFTAVNDVSFSVDRGQCFGLLGPNGAGKTTTISIICGILPADSGSVEFDGQSIGSDTSPTKRRIGYVPQDLALYEELSATDNLRLFGALYGLHGVNLHTRMDAALAVTSLQDRAHEKVGAYSGGMKRRLNIGAALLHDPDLLILDEPTVGVDPQSRNAIFDTLKQLQSAGKTIIYTTHYMEEVERLCDRVAIMDHGKIVANDTLSGLAALLGSKDGLQVELKPNGEAIWLPALRSRIGVRQAALNGNTLQVEVEDLARDVPAVLAWLYEQKIPFESASTRKAALEDVFLHLTGRSLRD